MTPPAKPSRIRYTILALLCALAMITYLDRAANGKAKGDLAAAVNVNVEEFFWVLMAFQLAYALCEIPSGWLGDTLGPRSTLLRVVLWWSFFVGLTGLAGYIKGWDIVLYGFGGLIAVQFLFGMGEAGAFPNISKALYNWFPAADRGFAKSIIWMSARLMGGLTPLIWVLFVEIAGFSWRQALGMFSAVAVLWCGVFAYWFRNKPAEHSSVNAAELEVISVGHSPPAPVSAVPWGILLRSANVRWLCVMYIATNFNWYFLMYYLPDKLTGSFPAANATTGGKILLAILGGAPLLIGMLGCVLGGIWSDRYIRRTGDRKWGRRIVGMTGYGLAGICYFLAAAAHLHIPDNLWLFAGLLMLVGFTNDLMMAPAWAAAQDIGRRYAGTVSGAMNMTGNLLGAVAGLLVTGKILKAYPHDGILICFTIYGIIYWLGVLAWYQLDASLPVVPDDYAGEAELAPGVNPNPGGSTSSSTGS